LSGAHFTRWRWPRVQGRRTFGDEAAAQDPERRASAYASSAPPPVPDAVSSAGAYRSWPSRAFVTGARPTAPSAPKAGAATRGHSCTTRLMRHKRRQCFVSALCSEGSPRRTEAVGRPRVPAWADGGDASEHQLPQQYRGHNEEEGVGLWSLRFGAACDGIRIEGDGLQREARSVSSSPLVSISPATPSLPCDSSPLDEWLCVELVAPPTRFASIEGEAEAEWIGCAHLPPLLESVRR
jgi:hypothetical protein